MEKKHFVFPKNGKSGKKSFRIALMATLPRVVV